MRAFRASGSFRIAKARWQPFTVEVAADDQEEATHRVLSNLGSRHRLRRNYIRINELKEISGEEISDLVVEYLVEGEK
ncbi:MAG: 50S ribosomal protein L18Ae [Methanomassiliicoccales archaeon]